MKCPDYIGSYHVMCCDDNCGWKGKANECDFRDDSLVYLVCPKCGYFITEDITSEIRAIFNKVPKKTIRTIHEPYWYCGIKGDGHYHKMEENAAQCVAKQQRLKDQKEKNGNETKYFDVLQMCEAGKKLKDIASHYDVSTTTVNVWIHKASRLKQNRLEAQSLSTGKTSDPVEVLCLSERTRNCIRNSGIKTIQGLINATDKQLLSVQNMGKTSLVELREAIRKYIT